MLWRALGALAGRVNVISSGNGPDPGPSALLCAGFGAAAAAADAALPLRLLLLLSLADGPAAAAAAAPAAPAAAAAICGASIVAVAVELLPAGAKPLLLLPASPAAAAAAAVSLPPLARGLKEGLPWLLLLPAAPHLYCSPRLVSSTSGCASGTLRAHSKYVCGTSTKQRQQHVVSRFKFLSNMHVSNVRDQCHLKHNRPCPQHHTKHVQHTLLPRL
jgi:hypothetical protein